MFYARLLSLATMALTFSAGCADECLSLSEDICFCEPTEDEQLSCIERINTESSNKTPTDAQRRACGQILDAGTCTCKALAAGDLQACGLTEPGVLVSGG